MLWFVVECRRYCRSDSFVAINVCEFEFKNNFAPEKFAFLKYWPRNSTLCTHVKW